MIEKNLAEYNLSDVSELIMENVDAVIVVDQELDEYRTLVKRGFFNNFLKESGSYHELILDLWFHFNDSSEKVSEDYQVFADNTGVFKQKYSRRLKLVSENDKQSHLVQLTVFPLVECQKYLFVMDEFIDSESLQESLTTKKISTIQSSYLFSMYIDLIKDTTSSINVAEISEDVVNYNLKYSEWRMMIVNMIWPEDQEQFLRRTDPEYLKKNFTPGRTSSYDCMMQNLEGKYIWVKLIFSRAQTQPDDYRFVFMVQDINENSMELLSALKKFEELAITDPLTGLFNHGEIETQFQIAVAVRKSNDDPVSVMLIDLDMFKQINDTYGHNAGDIALKHFAGLLKNFALSEKASVGRWGGEEFVIVCYNKTAEAVVDFAERIRKGVEAYDFPEIGKLTCSLGVTEVKSTDDFKAAFDRIDTAMYASKNNGRNMVTLL